jgi:predicted ATPase
MIQQLNIKNFKSIKDLNLDLARINVFIGANGSGKSNILEAIAFVSALENNNIHNEKLISKGIRIAKPSLTSAAFAGEATNNKLEFSFVFNDKKEDIVLIPEEKNNINTLWRTAKPNNQELLDYLRDFVIYQPNTPALRGMTNESHKEPLGIFGENLDVLIANFTIEEKAALDKYKNLVLWLEDYFIDGGNALKLKGYKLNRSLSNLYFKDKFMRKKDNNNVFAAENSNEGVLHLLFYIALLTSKRTPAFFAVDNIETSLNPHLCTYLMATICKIVTEQQNKQILISTHNPAILDGLNLNDDNIRLFEVKRNDKGHTIAERIRYKNEIPRPTNSNFKLSELWTRGLFAIDNNF